MLIKELKKLIRQDELLKATYIIETLLILNPKQIGLRYDAAKLYIKLKENHYRVKARYHLETILNITSDVKIIQKVIQLLVLNVYITHGPLEEAEKIIEKHKRILTEEQLATLEKKIKDVNDFLQLNTSKARIPENINNFQNIDVAIKTIFNQFNINTKNLNITKDKNSFFTFGSCFAGNVARTMQENGYRVESFFVGEEINTTFSNINLIKFILKQKVDNEDYYRKVLTGINIEYLCNKLKESDYVIYTLGIAPAFFDNKGNYTPHNKDNIKYLLKSNNHYVKFSSVEQNCKQLETLASILKQNTNVKKVFLTVSPVPLAVTFLSESAAVDDSESKSILRCTAGIVSRNDPDFFIYFPSFEVFRWLPMFRKHTSFGSDDGLTRHTNNSLVEKIVYNFIEMIK